MLGANLKPDQLSPAGNVFMKNQLRLIFLVVFTCWMLLPAKAQTAFGSEDELKTQAAKLFDDDQFEEAYPLYSQLASLYPKDPTYNYRLGVCMLYASDDKEKPIPFLEYASKRPDVEKEVLFYLARAYHLNYRFDEAITTYNEYKKVASSAKAEKLMVDRQIEMCRNGKKLLRNLTDLVVIDKKEMSRSDFFRSYDLSDIGGKLLVKPDEEAFKSALDKKKKEKSIIYLATNNNQVFFSSYGDDPDQGKDIYIIRKLPNGEWSKPQTLGYPVNTEYDEDFPFLHPNGKVLYFCSKGHNSMGGYDIFKTTLNEETNTWNKPVNMDFPINTPDDDILYVTNEDEKEAFFSSARNSVTGKTAVFHINVERKPIDIAIIKGAVVKNREGQALDVRITVKDLADNSMLGIYNAKAETGGYLINLPNGGKFMFTVEATGFKTQSEIVELPTQYEFKPLKQEISYELGTDKLIVKNLFDEAVDDASYLLALNFIKERSKMDVSSNPAENASPSTNETASNDTEANKEAGNAAEKGNKNGSLSNDQIVKIAYDDAQDTRKEADDLQEQANIALTMANDKADLAQNKSKEATQLMRDASMMEDNIKKQAATDEANQASKEADLLSQETVAAFNLAKKLGIRASAKNQEADLAMQYAKDLEAAVKSKNPEDAMAKLDQQEKQLEELSKQNGVAEPDNIMNGLKLDEQNKKKELDKAQQTSNDIRQEIADNETLMSNLQADADKTKKEDLKQGLLDQIAGLKEENEEKKKELESSLLAVEKVQKEYDGIKNEMAMVNSVVDQSKVGTNQQAVASVATIDQAKLENQVKELKSSNDQRQNSNTTGNNAVVANNTAVSSGNENKQNSNTEVVKNNAETPVENNKGNEVVNNPVTNQSNEQASNGNDSATEVAAKQPSLKEVYTTKLETADAIADPVQKEEAHLQLYNDWSNALAEDLKDKKAQLKSEKDKEKKKTLTAEIAELEKEQKEKSTMAANSKKELASLTKAQTLANNSSDSNKSGQAVDNNPTNNASGNGQDTNVGAETVSVRPANINATYSEQLNTASHLTDPQARQQAEKDALINWSKALDADVAQKQQEMATSTDPEMKALLAKKIQDEQQLSKEKLAQANGSNTTVVASNNSISNSTSENATNESNKSGNPELTKQGNNTNVAANNTNDQLVSNSGSGNGNENNNGNTTSTDQVVSSSSNGSSPAQLEQDLNQRLNSTSGTELEKEKQKAAAYFNYVDAANAQVEQKRVALSGETDNAKKAQLRNEIAGIQVKLSEHQKDLERTQQNIKNLEAGGSVAETTVVNPTNPTLAEENSNNQSVSNVQVSENAANLTNVSNSEKTLANADSGTENLKGNAALSNYYSSPATLAKAEQANKLVEEAANLSKQADELKTKAAGVNKTADKNAILAEADEMEKQAASKQAEASSLQAGANRTQFDSNAGLLDQYQQVSAKNTSDDASMAEMMKDESLTYFTKAQKSRDLAASSTNEYEKSSALTDAENNEKIALEKQQKSLALYQKINPGFVPKTSGAVSAGNSLATNNGANNENKGSNELANNGNAGNKSPVNNPAVNSTESAATNNSNETSVAGNSANKGSNPAENNNSTAVVNNNSNTSEIASNPTSTENQLAANGNAGNNAAVSNLNSTNAGNTNENQNSSVSNAVTTNNNSTTVGLAPNEKFERTKTAAYSAAKPIPVNEKLPEGVVYKVQIGAFRNPIQPEVFKGMSPITAETTPQGLTRYTAGLFTKFTTADKVKEEIRSLGYKDAFVVAFLNGKRIPIIQALGVSGEPASLASNANTTGVVNPVNESVNNVQTSGATTANTNAVNTSNEAAGSVTSGQQVATSTSVTTISGLFYTVQVGVYSQPVSVSKLNGLQPLNSERNANGTLRYSSGTFNNVPRANEARMIIFNGGIKDAFVTAYYNGQRISLPEAAKLEQQGSSVFVDRPGMNALPSFGNTKSTGNSSVAPLNNGNVAVIENPSNPATPTVENNTSPSGVGNGLSSVVQTTSIIADSGLVYKVQIGAFKDEVPLSIANKFLKIAKKGIQNYKDENGLTIYTVGKYGTYEESAASKAEVIAASEVVDAFIVAYMNGKKISVEEARKISGK